MVCPVRYTALQTNKIHLATTENVDNFCREEAKVVQTDCHADKVMVKVSLYDACTVVNTKNL